MTNYLTTAKNYSYASIDTPAEGNYKSIADLAIVGNTITMDATGDQSAIAAIAAKDDIITKAGTANKDVTLYATDVYVMNTLARYVGALERQATGTVKEINFNGVTYTWDGSLDGKGSKWKAVDNTTLISAIVTDQGTSIRTATLTLVDASDNSIIVTFNAMVPE